MPVSIPEFWKLVVDSRLLSGEQCRQLDAGFGGSTAAAQAENARPLVDWLVSQNALSRYQTDVLLGGKAGPFCFGDYKIYDRIAGGRLAGMFRAAHAPSGHPVLLQFLSGVAAQDRRVWATVVQRALALAGAGHNNLVQYYEPVDLTTYKLLALEDLRGQSAEDRLANSGPMKTGEACAVLRLALQGLAQLHQLGAAHGDIRPANFWIGASGNVKLQDFNFTFGQMTGSNTGLNTWNSAVTNGDTDGAFKLVDPDGLLTEPEYDLGVIARDDLLQSSEPRILTRRLATEMGLDADAVWEWSAAERVSTGLLCTRLGFQPFASDLLEAAERAADA